jgi:ABC-2 type transport system ATP-binding protein
MNNLLEAHHLVKRYGNRTVVKDIDLIVAPGEVVGLIGPNGAGKSTTLEMVLGLRTPDRGEVVFWCKDPRRQIGVQLQTTPFFRGLTVAENLTLFANFYGVRLTKKQVNDLLARSGMLHRSRADPLLRSPDLLLHLF